MPIAKAKPQALPRTWRWTREEYYRLYDQGFFQDRRVELIDGEIVEMPVMKNPHAVAITLVEEALRSAFGSGHWFRVQMPLHLGPDSEPEPDVAVVPGNPRDYDDHPTTALVLVEISEPTLAFDRGRKGSLYARAEIADYWIVNLVDRQLEVYGDPLRNKRRPEKSAYRQAATLKPPDTVTPLAMPNAQIKVADLLP
jgi:Uma2 family endonuclease